MLRHQDFSMYMRQREDYFGIGRQQAPSHAHLRSMPSGATTGARGSSHRCSEFTPEDFEPTWQEARKMIPALKNARMARPMNGLFSFTPDGGPLLGESKEGEGVLDREAVWITHAIGVGKVMAEWLTDGVPSIDLAGADVHRFEPYAKSPAYILACSTLSVRGLRHYPPPAADGGATSAADQPVLFTAEGFGARSSSKHQGGNVRNGSRRTKKMLDGQDDILGRGEWAGRYWSEIAAAEARATRERGRPLRHDLAQARRGHRAWRHGIPAASHPRARSTVRRAR